jgi:PAS domain S-box-containing protein
MNERVMPHDDHRQLLDALPDAILFVDAVKGIVFANQQAGEMFGLSQEQLHGRQVEDLLPERFRKTHVAHRAKCGACPAVRPMGADLELYAVRSNGEEFPVDISLSPVRTDDGMIVAASIRDISDRIRLQGEVRESAEFSRATLSSLHDHIAVIDQKGMVIAVNDAWTGFAQANDAAPDVCVGNGLNYLRICREAVNPDDDTAKEALVGIQAVLDGTLPTFTLEYPCHGPTAERWFLVNVVPLARHEGGAVISHTDITERKIAEFRLNDALEEVGRLKDRLHMESAYLQEEIKSSRNFEEIVGSSEELKLTLQKVEIVAPTDSNVLILGETGTGKELIARAIHSRGSREDRPLVKVDCAALPSTLIESELFGHVAGAFTGANANQIGRFELADGGTIFLDEIGELPLDLQTKLLRVLQDGEFEQLGSSKTKAVDVRVIAATNRDLAKAMDEGAFRPDLYYRLAVFPLEVPPLRLRRRDIPLLVWHFIEKKQAGLSRRIESVPDSAMDALMRYDWPGNVRELENVIERAVILSPGPTLMLDDFSAQPARSSRPDRPRQDREEIERVEISEVLEDCGWKIKGSGNAAECLGLKPSTLRYRMNRLGIERPPKHPR